MNLSAFGGFLRTSGLSLNKNIVCISNHGNMVGGGEHAFLDLLTNLPDSWRPLAVVPCLGELKALLEKTGVPTQRIPLPPIHPLTLPKMLQTIKRIVSLCRKSNPVLLYANGSRAAFYAVFSKLFHKVPVVWHCRIAARDPRLDFMLRYMSNRVIVNSQATAARFDLNFQPKIRIVHNGVDIAWLGDNNVQVPAMIEEEWKVILVVARVSRWKRHDLILPAFEAVAKRDPAVHLVCIGAMDQFEPDWWGHLQKQSAQSLVSDRIHWIGQVDDVRPWYRAASMMVLASDNESFGRVIVEAMASGVPVIATRSGGIPEIIRQGQDGLIVTPWNHKEIADAIIKILDDESLRSRLVKSARKRAELFDLGRHVQTIVEVFEETARQ